MGLLSDLTYGIVGLGVMGGSLAKALREYVLCAPKASGRILACDANGASLAKAAEERVTDGSFRKDEVPEMLKLCDIVFVCLYPKDTVEFLISHKMAFKSGSAVCDISGVKSYIFSQLPRLVRDDVDFVLLHPMAGNEREGFGASSGEVFNGRNCVLIPHSRNKPETLELFRSLITALGFSRIVETDAATHDRKIAFTSQLCHVIASALVDSAEDDRITAFGGGSFEDLTRIAMINAPLWTELFLENKQNLLSHIENFEASLDEIKGFIKKDDAASLTDYLENVRRRRIRMSSMDIKV